MPLVNKKKVITYPLPSLKEVIPLPLPALPDIHPAPSGHSGHISQPGSSSEPSLNEKEEKPSPPLQQPISSSSAQNAIPTTTAPPTSADDLTNLPNPTPSQILTWLTRARTAQARLLEENNGVVNGPSGRRVGKGSSAAGVVMGGAVKGKPSTNSSPGVSGTNVDNKPETDTPLSTDLKSTQHPVLGHGQGQGQEESTPTVPTEYKKEFDLMKWKEPEVWMIERTGEVFLTYEAYADRISFYHQKIFQGETSSNPNTLLNYPTALTADIEESRSLHRAFPEGLKGPILRGVQFHIEGRLDDLTDHVYDRFANRYFLNDKVFVQLDGDKYLANISAIYPPASLAQPTRKGIKSEPGSMPPPITPHALGCDLNISSDKAVGKDDPSEYEYQVQLITQEDIDRSVGYGIGEDGSDKWGTRSFRVPADQLHRDRTQFSKTNLKRFLKDCLDRDSLSYSPWIVKPAVAQAYGIPTEMSEKTRSKLEAYRENRMEARKRPRTTKEDEDELDDAPPPLKKSKKVTASKEERHKIAEEERLKQEEEERVQQEEERKRRRKPTKFPAEDLLLEHTLHEKRHQKPLARPVPSTSLPFRGHFEIFLLTWSFLNSMSKPLGLSQFTLDQFENALYQSDPQTNVLLTEVHAVLLNTIRRDHTEFEQPRVYPLKAFEPVVESDDSETRASSPLDSEYSLEDNKTKLVSQASMDHMQTWEARELSPATGRKDWQKSLVGCLWARGMVSTLPNLLTYMRHLLLEDDKSKPSNGPGWVAEPSQPKLAKRLDYRYATLNHVFRLEIIAFLCELVMQTKLCRDVLDESTNAVTRCRVDQNEVRRELRRIHMELDALEPKTPVVPTDADGMDVDGEGVNGDGSPNRASVSPSANGTGTDREDADRTVPSDDSDSEADSVTDNKRGKASALRQKLLTAQQAQREADQARRKVELQQAAEQAKAKRLEGKALTAEKKRLNDEIVSLDQQLEELEREFRRQYSYLRMSPLGQDRFGNKIWWFDGCGSADIVDIGGGIIYGTGRLYIQGCSPSELARRAELAELTPEELEEKRTAEETPEGCIPEGAWGFFDHPDQFGTFCKWLNGKGLRETRLLDVLRKWEYAIEGGMRKRLEVFEIEAPTNGDVDGMAKRVRRPAGSRTEPQHRGREAYLNYKNHFATK